MYISLYLSCCIRTSVILNSIFISLLLSWRTSITSFSFSLFTWVVYCMMFRMEMMCTGVSCCFIHSCISRFIRHLISGVSFIVAVPISHCSASPKKGIRLIFGHGLSALDNLLWVSSLLSSCIAICMVGSYNW